MDRNTVIGMTLIFFLFLIWFQINAPTPEEIEANKKLELARQDSLKNLDNDETTAILPPKTNVNPANFGSWASKVTGEEQTQTLENDLFTVVFTNKGGRIKEVIMKDYFKLWPNEAKEEIRSTLKLLEDAQNKFEYLIPAADIPGGELNTGELFFTPSVAGNTITFKVDAGDGRFIEQKYTVSPDNYAIDYDVRFVGLNPSNNIKLNWVNYLDKIEKNTSYERNLSTVYYKPASDDPTYCSCTGDDQEDADDEKIKWVSHSHQFFNTTLIGEKPFKSAFLETEVLDLEDKNLKKLKTSFVLPIEGDETYAMQMYIGPNEYERLSAYEVELEDIIPYGRSIFGTINRWIIRPIFNVLSGFIGSAGIVILLLTLLVKLVLYPFTYKMLHSQSKMGALKPQLAKMKEKFPDDSQKQQMETMKMYREFGVNPLGGCLPVAAQMPIWFALYRFFPASIEFRQAPFLWATDLSSYDVFANLPFEIPFYGAHISLFTLLWAVSTIVYTYYNTKYMDMSANPMMKYMQYGMPVMFLFFFNNFAAGLTCYLFFSNLMNIGQTVITKNYIINQDKIKKDLDEYKKKPKKKGGFQERLEKALKDQQKVAEQQKNQPKKKKK